MECLNFIRVRIPFNALILCLLPAWSFSQGLNITSEICESCTVADKEYLLYLPDTYNPANSYKLIIFLHGLQQQEDWNPELLRNKGLMRVIGKSDVFIPYKDDYIVIAPFTKNEIWEVRNIREKLDHIVTRYPAINTEQVFITGMSMGGKGSWDFAIRYPEDVTGIIPMFSNVNVGSYNGSDSTFTLCNLADVAIWTIDGEHDPKAPPQDIKLDRDGSFRWGSRLVSNTLVNECNPQIKPISNIWASKTHHGWDQVYSLSAGYDIYRWMDQLDKENGILTTEGVPIVTLPENLNIDASTGKWTIQAIAIEPNGKTLDYRWNVTPDDPSLSYTFDASAELFTISDFDPGIYTITVDVSNPDGISQTASTTIHAISDPGGYPDLTTTEIFSYDPGIPDYSEVLSANQIFSFAEIGTDLLNIRANGNEFTNSFRFGLNNIRDFRTETKVNTGYLGRSGNNDFVADDGDYLITITACGDNFCETQGISRQYSVEFSAEPLPVTFASVRAYRTNDGNVRIEWSTAAEYNNVNFEILRWTYSNPDKQVIATVPKQGNENGFTHYSYTDKNAPAESVYYQVINVDADESRQYSRTVGADAEISSIIAWPNPAVPGSRVRLSVLPDSQIQLYTLQGGALPVDITNSYFTAPAPGIYILRINNQKEARSIKLIVQNFGFHP